MRCSFGRIIPVRPEMPAVLCRIAGDDVALHARGFERMYFQNLRIDASYHASLKLADQLWVPDGVVLAPLVGMVLNNDCLAADIAHEP
jgi:hypothetical protein